MPASFLLLEDLSYLLQEDGFKILLEQQGDTPPGDGGAEDHLTLGTVESFSTSPDPALGGRGFS